MRAARITRQPIRRLGKIRGLAFALALALPGGPAYGIDLLGVYDLAAQDDPEIRRGLHEYLASRELIPQARAGFLPTFSVEAETGGTHQNIRSSDNAIFAPGINSFVTHRLTLSLNQPIYRHLALVNRRQARAALKRADLEFETVKQELILRVAMLYFGALAAQQEFQFSETERTALERHYELVDLQRQRGLATVTDLYDARARLATVEALVIETEDNWDDAVEALREVSRQVPASLAPLDSEVPLIPPSPSAFEMWVDAAQAQNPALLAQSQAVEIARHEVARQKSGRYPTLDLVARGNRERSGGSLYGGGSHTETSNVLMCLTFPIYQGGILGSRVREARESLQSAEQELERQSRALQRQVRGAFYGVTRAISRVTALEEAIRAQELALEARQEGYRSGLYSTIEVLDAGETCSRYGEITPEPVTIMF